MYIPFQHMESWNGIESGMLVKVPDGRHGIIKNYRLYNEGPNAPGRVSVQFYNTVTARYEEEGYSIMDVSALCPCCGGTGRVIDAE